MSEDTTPAPAPELPPRPSAVDVQGIIDFPIEDMRTTKMLVAEVLHLRAELDEAREFVKVEGWRADAMSRLEAESKAALVQLREDMERVTDECDKLRARVAELEAGTSAELASIKAQQAQPQQDEEWEEFVPVVGETYPARYEFRSNDKTAWGAGFYCGHEVRANHCPNIGLYRRPKQQVAPAQELPERYTPEEVEEALTGMSDEPKAARCILVAEVRHLRVELEHSQGLLRSCMAEKDDIRAGRHNLATVTQERDALKACAGITERQIANLTASAEAMERERDRLAGELAKVKDAPPPADDPTEGGRYYELDPKTDVRVPGLECWDEDAQQWARLMGLSCDPSERLGPSVRYRAPVTSQQPHRETVQPARPQVTAWELWCTALELHRDDDGEQPVAHYYERAHKLLASAAAFLAEKGVKP